MSANLHIRGFLIVILNLAVLLLINSQAQEVAAQHLPPISKEVTVSASIGEPKLVLWGYGPANSVVKLEGIGISDSTLSNQSGYFQFTSVFLPTQSVHEKDLFYPEICIQAIDENGLTTQPTCIPPLATSNYFYNIGPVILSPTIFLEKGGTIPGGQIKASGKTLPNSDVRIYLAREKSAGSIINFVSEVSAYYIPEYQIVSDSTGNYEFNLPSDSPDKWKVFSATKYQNSNSPISNTLKFEILPFWLYLIKRIISYLLGIKNLLFFIVLFLQILAVIILLRHTGKKPKQHHNTINI